MAKNSKPKKTAELRRQEDNLPKKKVMGKMANGLTPSQKRMLKVISEPDFDMNISDMCRKAGVKRSIYYEAMNNPLFVSELFNIPRADMSLAVPAVARKIITQSKAGNPIHQRLILEASNFFHKQAEAKLNIGNVENVTIQWAGGQAIQPVIPVNDDAS